MTAGQALMLAKQSAFAQVGVTDVYWTKASAEATFYGLPMYRVGADGGEGDSVLPPAATGADPTDPTTRSSTPFSVDLRDRLNQTETSAAPTGGSTSRSRSSSSASRSSPSSPRT